MSFIDKPLKHAQKAQQVAETAKQLKQMATQVAGMLSHGVMAKVKYDFKCPSGPPVEWQVRGFHLEEALSEPYRMSVEIGTKDTSVDISQLLGAACELELDRLTANRSVCGIIHDHQRLGVVADRVWVRVDVVPAVALLDMRVDTRFWQDKNAVDIVEEVLKAPLAELARKLRFDVDRASVPVREYCVQFRESDFDFACRLLQEEGLFFYFEHKDGAEVFVVVDNAARCPEVKLPPPMVALSYVPKGTGTATSESIVEFEWRRALRSTSVVQRDWDWLKPPDSPYLRERRGKDDRDRDREVYEHDDRRLASDPKAPDKPQIDDGEARARRKLEALSFSREVGHGRSDAIGFAPGHRFRMLGHPEGAFEKKRFLLLRARHEGDAPDVSLFAGHEGADKARYVNAFECIPDDVPYRPLRREKPRVHGPLTAVVVGPPGEEIHTDMHGRIKVLFHWDRLSPRDDPASCWIRVAQTWSGAGWGAIFLPRIGMEVLVEFIDGDPDRPLVTSCVYNNYNKPPYPLPAEKTKSTIKSDSSPGGGGSNELRFEDKKGSEEVYFHAQKDLNEVVENNNTRSVGANQTFSIGENQSFSVGASQSFSVGGSQSFSVSGDRTVNVTKTETTTVKLDRTVNVTDGASSLNVNTGSHTETVNTDISMSSVTADVKVHAKNNVSITAETATLRAVAKQNATLASGEADVNIRANKNASFITELGTLKLQGQTDASLISVEAGVFISAPTKTVLRSDDAVSISGKTISIHAIEKIVLSVGASVISIESSGITLSSPSITSEATGNHTISGAIIKLN
jgi:type VI secretion system secreted protein VgrG